MKVYIVTAHRYGNESDTAYTVGVYSNKKKAFAAAVLEEYASDGKYTCRIIRTPVNSNLRDTLNAEIIKGVSFNLFD